MWVYVCVSVCNCVSVCVSVVCVRGTGQKFGPYERTSNSSGLHPTRREELNVTKVFLTS